MTVSLREITAETVIAVCKLDAGDGWKHVAPNAVSIAQAYFAPEAWFRAIYEDETLAGFLMLYDPTRVPSPKESDLFLWRLMIDQKFQGRGLGAAAVGQVIAHARALPGISRLMVSHTQGVDRLARFYTRLGFRYTGAVDEGELVMERPLAPN